MNEYFITSKFSSDPNAELADMYNNSILTDRCFSFELTTVVEIESILRPLKSTALESDKISPKMITLCCPFVLPVVTHVINTCLLEGVFTVGRIV